MRIQRNGKDRYVYADPAHNQIFVAGLWTDIRFGALHGSFSPALFGTAVPCGNALPRFAGFPHQAVIQPRIKAGFVVGIGPGGLAKTSPKILETVAHHLGNVPESGKVLFFRANQADRIRPERGWRPEGLEWSKTDQTARYSPVSREPQFKIIVNTDGRSIFPSVLRGI